MGLGREWLLRTLDTTAQDIAAFGVGLFLWTSVAVGVRSGRLDDELLSLRKWVLLPCATLFAAAGLFRRILTTDHGILGWLPIAWVLAVMASALDLPPGY